MSAGSSDLCQFCEEERGKYTCPRCNVNYCSVPCYRSARHAACSEAFYKQCVEQELRVREPDPESRARTVEMLKRVYEQDRGDDLSSGDSDDDDALEERLRGIDLDDTQLLWSRLTHEERREFLDMAGAGDVTKLVPVWDPWWSRTHPKRKVTFVDDPHPTTDFKTLCPNLISDVPPVQSLSKSKPSPLVFNNLLNVLSAYALTARFLNGEHHESPCESASLLLTLSKNLSENVTYDTLDLAIESVGKESVDNQTIGATKETVDQMRNDVAKLSLGPSDDEPWYYVSAALSDISALLREAVKLLKTEKTLNLKSALPAVFEKKLEVTHSKKHMLIADKKIHYYLSWTKSYYLEIIETFKQSLPS